MYFYVDGVKRYHSIQNQKIKCILFNKIHLKRTANLQLYRKLPTKGRVPKFLLPPPTSRPSPHAVQQLYTAARKCTFYHILLRHFPLPFSLPWWDDGWFFTPPKGYPASRQSVAGDVIKREFYNAWCQKGWLQSVLCQVARSAVSGSDLIYFPSLKNWKIMLMWIR